MKYCSRCQADKTPDQFYRASKTSKAKDGLYAYCKPCTRSYQNALLAKRRDDPNWAERERAQRNAAAQRHAKKLRTEVLMAYGNCCACCHEATPEFLGIDHIFNDGASHRLEIGTGRGTGSTTTYRWLKNRGFPQDCFQLLCHNCNLAKAHYGQCPHEASKLP